MKSLHKKVTATMLAATAVTALAVGSNAYVDTKPDCEHAETSFSCIEYVSNYDGDTIKVNIPQVHSLFGKAISVRVKGIDTAEIRTESLCERGMAVLARNIVHKELFGAQNISLEEIGRDKYFRVLAKVKYDKDIPGEFFTETRDLGSYLIEKGLAVPYDGSQKPDVDWCEMWGKIKG